MASDGYDYPQPASARFGGGQSYSPVTGSNNGYGGPPPGYPPQNQPYDPPPGPPPTGNFYGRPPPGGGPPLSQPSLPGSWRPPPSSGWAPARQQYQGGMPPPNFALPPPPPSFAPKVPQRHIGPSGADGAWQTNDLVADPEEMLDEAQLKVWKEFDNKEIDRDGLKLTFLQRLRAGQIDWAKWRSDQLKWKNMQQWLIVLFSIALGVVILIEQKHIVNGIRPTGQKLKNMKLGWLIPAGILFVLSFPPLFGAEIIVIIIALSWNIWVAWGITSLGTMAGEVANYWLWKWIMHTRQTRYENKSLYWAKLSKVSKDGGFIICLVIRYSLIPTHISTTLFAACGVNFVIYFISTLLSQPRWLFHVFVGHAYGSTESHTEKLIFTAVSIAFGVTTQLAMNWLTKKQNACDPEIKQILRQRRADALNAARTTRPFGGKRTGPSLSEGDSSVYHLQIPRGGHKASESTSSLQSTSETLYGGSTAQLHAGGKEGEWRE